MDEQSNRQAGRWGGNIDCEIILFLVGAIFGLIGIKKLRKFLLLYNNEEKK